MPRLHNAHGFTVGELARVRLEDVVESDKNVKQGPLDRLFTIYEVADHCRVSPSTVRFWIRIGRLSSTKLGRRRLVTQPQLEVFLSAGGHE